MQLFCDMDGVLADFDRHYFNLFGVRLTKGGNPGVWANLRKTPSFFDTIPPMSDALELWARIEQYEPVILTGIPNKRDVPEAEANKVNWIHHYISFGAEVRCCRSQDKCLHACPGDILIDDREKYKHLWIDMGGTWITHHSAAETIAILDGMGL